MSDLPNHLTASESPGAVEAALRRYYAVPSGYAPFLTFDAVVRRAAMRDESDESDDAQFAVLAADELARADKWSADANSFASSDVARPREKVTKMTSFDAPDNPVGYDAQPTVADVDARWERIRRAATGDATPEATSSEAARRPARRSAPSTRPPARKRNVTRGLLAAAAAILIVGLLGGVLYHFGANRPGGQIGHHATQTIHYLGAKATWQTVGQFPETRLPAAPISYFVEQSNPMLVYRYDYSKAFVLQESTDAGATWQNLALPQQDFPGVTPHYVTLSISPVNPNILILILGSDQNNPACPPYVNAGVPGADSAARYSRAGQMSAQAATTRLAPSIPSSGGYNCTFQYVSSDGGTSWRTLTLPDKLKLSFGFSLQTSTDASGAVTASRLYANAAPDTNGQYTAATRLMMSVDGGLTWTFADEPIIAKGQVTYSFAASNTGSTLFDQTIAAGKTYSVINGVATPTEFWRSDDAGAHWTDLGPAPSIDQYGDLGQLTVIQAAGKTLLYAEAPNFSLTNGEGIPGGSPMATPDGIFVSSDNGKTWQHAPKAGVAPGLGAPGGPIGILSDGSVIFQFTKEKEIVTKLPGGGTDGQTVDEGSIYYAWKPGASSWEQLAPKLDEDWVEQQWLAPASNGQPETIWVVALRGNTLYLEKCALS